PGTIRCWSAMSCWFATVRRWQRSGYPSRAANGRFPTITELRSLYGSFQLKKILLI
ncbi:MAG: hypothetical protein HOC71_18735, partial [Candidatus Latescibacteria bacterium]|nr:hypothetical protein [Candidatus Latescibacterota bacterium]